MLLIGGREGTEIRREKERTTNGKEGQNQGIKKGEKAIVEYHSKLRGRDENNDERRKAREKKRN